jgi:hypothetical protein
MRALRLFSLAWNATPDAGRLGSAVRAVRKVVLIVAASVLFFGAVIEGVSIWREVTTHDIAGRLVFRGAALDAMPGSECDAPPLSLIGYGSHIEVKDEDDHRLGDTYLGRGTAATGGACVFTFTVENVGNADRYTFDFAAFGLRREHVSRDELARNGWRVQFIAETDR